MAGQNVKKKIEKAIEKKKDLVTKENSRVVFARVPTTHRIYNISQQADRANRLVRNRLAEPKYMDQLDEMVTGLKEFNEAVEALDLAAEKLCKLANIKYYKDEPEETGKKNEKAS